MTAGELYKKLAELGTHDDGSCEEMMADHFTLILSALEDAQRLDWMQARNATSVWGGVISRREGFRRDAASVEWVPEDGGIMYQTERFETLRKAIDAARAKENDCG